MRRRRRAPGVGGGAAAAVTPYKTHKPEFVARRKQLKAPIHLAPKSNKRCQCTINRALFNIVKEDMMAKGQIVLDFLPNTTIYPELFKPIYKPAASGIPRTVGVSKKKKSKKKKKKSTLKGRNGGRRRKKRRRKKRRTRKKHR